MSGARLLGVALVLSLGAAGCSASGNSGSGNSGSGNSGSGNSGSGNSAGPGGSIRSVRAPLDGSVATSSGAWVDVAMGDTSQTADTFWQLMVEPAGASRWALVTPPGFADNGGLMSAQVGPTFVAGFGASALLHFSPLSSTTNGGSAWTQGVVDQPLTPVPDALAGSVTGDVDALTGSRGTAVLSSTGALSNWHTVVTQKALAASVAGRRCGVTALSALSFVPGGGLLVGATCVDPGHVGMFATSTGGFSGVGPSLAPGEAKAATTVLRLRGWTGGVTALVEARSSAGTVLLGTSSDGGGGKWSTPVALSLTATEEVASSGISADGGLVVLLTDGGRQTAEELTASSASWTALPVPPTGTAAIALVSPAETDAVAVQGSQLHVFHLDAAQGDWQMVQVIKVPIQYGSSS